MSEPERFGGFTAPVPVESFKSASNNNDPLLYPGDRPESSFITDGTTVFPIDARNTDGNLEFYLGVPGDERSVDEFLSRHGANPLAERVPVLAFGANMCPGSLLSKYKKVGREDALVVPTIYAELPNHDVVWSAGPGLNGNPIALLYSGPKAEDTSVQVGVNFLTREQLLVLNATEMNYELQKLEVDIAGTKVPVYFYAGRDKIFVENESPMAVNSIPARGRKLEAASAAQVLGMILLSETVMEALKKQGVTVSGHGLSAREYVNYVTELKKTPAGKPRTRLKEAVAAALAESNNSRTIETGTEHIVSWANPSTIPTYGEWLLGSNDGSLIRLPSQELPRHKWSDQQARNKVLGSIGTHFHRHWQV